MQMIKTLTLQQYARGSTIHVQQELHHFFQRKSVRVTPFIDVVTTILLVTAIAVSS